MRRIDYDGQVAHLSQQGNRRQVQRVARGRLERADAALAQDDLVVSVAGDVFGRKQEFLDGRAHSALQQDGTARIAELFEKGEVLHVACADLKYVGVFRDQFHVFRSYDLGNYPQARLFPRLGQQLQSLFLESLKVIG